MAVFCCQRKIKLRERSPLKYNPDDPSTYPIEEKKKKKKKEKKDKKSSKQESTSLSSGKSGKSPAIGSRGVAEHEEASGADSPMRAPNDLETVGMITSAWGEVQEGRRTTEEQ
ncbi:hypothetical protein Y032_0042g531 [Ancylostoma ceylanicum]|nr:hypothetical protein Y032_0042g531 [Ancylostoma ceylanicum]